MLYGKCFHLMASSCFFTRYGTIRWRLWRQSLLASFLGVLCLRIFCNNLWYFRVANWHTHTIILRFGFKKKVSANTTGTHELLYGEKIKSSLIPEQKLLARDRGQGCVWQILYRSGNDSALPKIKERQHDVSRTSVFLFLKCPVSDSTCYKKAIMF